LIEESTDIDSHILNFKNDLNRNKIQEVKTKMQDEFRDKLR
jgi:hypothetical protein